MPVLHTRVKVRLNSRNDHGNSESLGEFQGLLCHFEFFIQFFSTGIIQTNTDRATNKRDLGELVIVSCIHPFKTTRVSNVQDSTYSRIFDQCLNSYNSVDSVDLKTVVFVALVSERSGTRVK